MRSHRHSISSVAKASYRHRLLAGVLATALLAAPVYMSAGLAEQPGEVAPVGQIVKLRGTAEITRGRATVPLILGAPVAPGDVVKTGPGARLKLHFIDGSSVALGEGAELRIGAYTVAGDQKTRDALLALGQGTLHAVAAKAGPNSRFEIRTPLAYSSVRGTEWFVDAAPQETDVAVVSGRVGVGLAKITAESAVSIGRNAKIAVTAADGLGDSRLLTEAEIAALLAATETPGDELDFNLDAAPKLDLPVPASGQDDAAPGTPSNAKPKDCLRPGDPGCGGRGGDKDRGGNGGNKGGGHNHDHDNDHDTGGGGGGGGSGNQGG